MFCENCGIEITDDNQKFCHKCGTPLRGRQEQGNQKKASRFKAFVGEKGMMELHFRDIFSGIAKHHEPEEVENLFLCGMSTTTPKEQDLIEEWPKPWLYSRILMLFLLMYFTLEYMWKVYHNGNILMNIPIIGTLIMPITFMILLFELNVPRNISIAKVCKVFFVGGITSLFFTLLFNVLLPESNTMDVKTAIMVGIVEEAAKMLICAYFISKHKGRLFLLNGILYGGAVGVGFAVFESIGYAFRFGIFEGINQILEIIQNQQMPDIMNFYHAFYVKMKEVMEIRGFFAPGGHIAWAAVEGFAIVLALEGAKFTWNVLAKEKFLKIVWIPIVLHSIWDMPVLEQEIRGISVKYIILMVIILVLLLVFVNEGMKEVVEVQRRAVEQEE